MEQADALDGEYRVSNRSMIAAFRKDLSYMPENSVSIGKTRYMMLLTYRLKIGKVFDFENGAKMIIGAYNKAKLDSAVITYQGVAGGQEGAYYFLIPMASLKSMDDEPARQKALMDAMGGPENFQQFVKGSGEVFTSMESQLYAVSPEMSYVSKATEDEDPAFWRPKSAARAEKPKEEKPKEKTTP